MEIPREMVIERIRSRGDTDATERAARELPEKVDPQRDRALLASFEVDPADLEEDLGGQSPAVG
jgi:hypothetical protein